MTQYPNREVYSASPLALVVAQVRFTDSARLRQQASLDSIALDLEARFPVVRSAPQVAFQVSMGDGAAQSLQPTQNPIVLIDNSSTESVTIASDSFTYETTRYRDFESLLSVMSDVTNALLRAGVTPAVERIGLRYIDEVRVPVAIDHVTDWATWVDHRLVDHLRLGPESKPVAMMQSITTFNLGDQRGLNFRAAALNGGAVVEPQFLATKPLASDGPVFVLDFDGYEEFPQNRVQALTSAIVTSSLEAVHGPAGEMFQATITDKARQIFREETS